MCESGEGGQESECGVCEMNEREISTSETIAN